MGLFDQIQAEASQFISLPEAFDHIAKAEGDAYKAAVILSYFLEDFKSIPCCFMGSDMLPVWNDCFGNSIDRITRFTTDAFCAMATDKQEGLGTHELNQGIRDLHNDYYFLKSDFYALEPVKRLGLSYTPEPTQAETSLLSRQAGFTMTEAACLLSNESPVMIELCRNDTNFEKNYTHHLEAENFINGAWRAGEISTQNNIFSRAEIKRLFENAGIHIHGLTDDQPQPQKAPKIPEAALEEYPTDNIGQRNQRKKDLQGMARILAAHWWQNDQQQTTTGDMADRVYREVRKYAPVGLMPENIEAVKNWIRPVAPKYAQKGGRPKNPPER